MCFYFRTLPSTSAICLSHQYNLMVSWHFSFFLYCNPTGMIYECQTAFSIFMSLFCKSTFQCSHASTRSNRTVSKKEFYPTRLIIVQRTVRTAAIRRCVKISRKSQTLDRCVAYGDSSISRMSVAVGVCFVMRYVAVGFIRIPVLQST